MSVLKRGPRRSGGMQIQHRHTSLQDRVPLRVRNRERDGAVTSCGHCGMPHPTSRCNRPEGVAARGRKLTTFEIPNLLIAPANAASRAIGRRRATAVRRRGRIQRAWAR